MRLSRVGRATTLGAGVAALLIAPASFAQAPPSYPPPPPYPPPAAAVPGPPEAAEIATCLCLHRDVGALSAELAARHQAYDAAQGEVARFDAQLEQARAGVDVNDPRSVAQFRQLLERRDAAFTRQRGAVFDALSSATERYNARIGEYNARCANRPQNAELVARVEATLICPAPPR